MLASKRPIKKRVMPFPFARGFAVVSERDRMNSYIPIAIIANPPIVRSDVKNDRRSSNAASVFGKADSMDCLWLRMLCIFFSEVEKGGREVKPAARNVADSVFVLRI